MGLREYVIRRSVYLFYLIIIVTAFNFFMFRIASFMFGITPVNLMIGGLKENLNPEKIAQLYRDFGLVQNPTIADWIWMFVLYMRNTLSGNFGRSIYSKNLVIDEIMWRLPNTLLLMGTSALISISLGIWLGVRVARHPGSKGDVAAISISLFLYSLPIFWFGLMLLMIFGYYIPLFPLFGTMSKPPPSNPILFALDVLWHLTLPATALGIGGFGGYFLYMRSNLIDVMTEDYILTARAKGLDEHTVLYKHAMKNAMLPMVTIIAITIAGLVGGATLTETVFNWYGLGRYIFDSLVLLDYPVVQAIFFIMSILTVLANFAADLLYGVLDPRIKYS